MSRILLLGALAAGAFALTYGLVLWGQRPPEAPPGMVWVPGGAFTMGTDAEPGWPDAFRL